MILLTGQDKQKCKASSTLNRSSEFAARNMFNSDVNSCWNSDQGSPQSILIDFGRNVKVGSLRLTFQGGFVGQDCDVLCGMNSSALEHVETIYPDDSNDCQEFSLLTTTGAMIDARFMQILFPSSTDFYGRVTIYALEVYGSEGDDDEIS